MILIRSGQEHGELEEENERWDAEEVEILIGGKGTKKLKRRDGEG